MPCLDLCLPIRNHWSLVFFLVNVRELLIARGKIVDPCFFFLTNIAIFCPALSALLFGIMALWHAIANGIRHTMCCVHYLLILYFCIHWTLSPGKCKSQQTHITIHTSNQLILLNKPWSLFEEEEKTRSCWCTVRPSASILVLLSSWGWFSFASRAKTVASPLNLFLHLAANH